MKKIFSLLFLIILVSLFLVKPVKAADTLLFDSTNHYLGGCLLTDKSEWELTKDLNVTKFQLWYNWDQGETDLEVTVLKDNTEFAKFKATRAECDPYQKSWCNASFVINKLFPKGNYSTSIPNKKQCLKPGGTGTVLLYGTETTTKDQNISPIKAIPTSTIIPTQPLTNQVAVTSCPSCNTKMVVTAIITFLTTLVISLLLFKK